MREHRLLHYRAEDFDPKKNPLTVATPSTPTMTATWNPNTQSYDTTSSSAARDQLRVNPRRAEEIAGDQDAIHRAQVAQNQTSATPQRAVMVTNPDTGQLEPARDENGNPIFQDNPAGFSDPFANNPAYTYDSRERTLGTPTGGAMGQAGAVGYNPNVRPGESGIPTASPLEMKSVSNIDALNAAVEDAKKDLETRRMNNEFINNQSGLWQAEDKIKKAEQARDEEIRRVSAENERMKNRLKTETESATQSTTPGTDIYGNQQEFDERNVATVPTTTTAAIQAMIQSADPTTAAMLQTALGILGQRMQDIGTEYYKEEDRAKAEFEMFQGIVGEMVDRQKELSVMKANLLKTTQDEAQQLAEQQRQAALAANETARQQTELNLLEQRRQLAVANAKKVRSMIGRNAVLGGFGSMASIEEIERTEFEGSAAVANFTAQMALIDKSYSDKALEINANYTNTIVTIHQNYANDMIDVVSKYNDKVDEAMKLKIGGAQRMEDKITNARTTMRNDWMKVQDDMLGYMQKAVDDARDAANKLRDDALQKQRDAFTQAMKIADVYGTKNPDLFSGFEDTLGLPRGTFSNTKTLEELRMKSTGGVAGAAATAKLVEEQRAQIRQLYPTASGEMVDTLVYATLQKLLPQKSLLTAYSYMSGNTINGEQYRIQPYLTASQGEDAVALSQMQLEDQRALSIGEKTPEQLVNELQDSNIIDTPMTDDQVIKYMQGMGYTYVDDDNFWDSWFKPLGKKFVSPLPMTLAP